MILKKIFYLVLLLNISPRLSSQVLNEITVYSNSRSIADSFYYNCNYLEALNYYRILNNNFSYRNHSDNMAACCVYLDYPSDSTFKYLLTKNNLVFYWHLSHPAFEKIEKDKRWEKVLYGISNKMKTNNEAIDEIRLRLIKMSITDYRYRLMLIDSCHPIDNIDSINSKIRLNDSINFKDLEDIINTIGWPIPKIVGLDAAMSAYSVWMHTPFARREKYKNIVEFFEQNGVIDNDFIRLADIEAYIKKEINHYRGKPTNNEKH